MRATPSVQAGRALSAMLGYAAPCAGRVGVRAPLSAAAPRMLAQRVPAAQPRYEGSPASPDSCCQLVCMHHVSHFTVQESRVAPSRALARKAAHPACTGYWWLESRGASQVWCWQSLRGPAACHRADGLPPFAASMQMLSSLLWQKHHKHLHRGYLTASSNAFTHHLIQPAYLCFLTS